MSKPLKCPICGKDTTEYLCPNCGWEFRVFPDGCPESILMGEEKRKEIAHSIWQGNCAREKKVELLQDEIQKEKNKCAVLESERSLLEKEVKEEKERVKQIEKDLSACRQNNAKEIRNINYDLKTEKERSARYQKELSIIKQELIKVTDNLAKAKTTFANDSFIKPQAFLSVKQDLIEDQIFGLYPGENAFGKIRGHKGNDIKGKQLIRFPNIGCPDFLFFINLYEDGTICLNDITGHVTMLRGIKNKSLASGSTFQINETRAICTISIPN